MIKINRGEVKFKGNMLDLSVEIVMGVRAFYLELSKIYGKAGAEKIVRESLERAFMPREKIHEDAIDAFVKIAKKVNRPQEDE